MNKHRHDPATPSTAPSTDRLGQGSGVTAGQGTPASESCHERVTPGFSASGYSAGRPGTGTGPNADAVSRVTLTHGTAHRDSGRGAGRRGLSDLLARLSPRDIALIDLLAEHRFLTTHHLQAFCFHDHASLGSAARSARRVLARLASEHLIERPARRVGGTYAGSEATVWRLTSLGHRLRSLRSGAGSAPRVRTPSTRFIEHYLAVADVRIALVDAERRSLLIVSKVQIEPVCWQPFIGLGGSREVLKPDLAATTTPATARDFEDHWYLEVDRATESLPTVLRQCRAYEACRQSGVVQAERGIFPLVAWIVPSERRATGIRSAIARARGLDAALYRVCTTDQLLPLILGGAA